MSGARLIIGDTRRVLATLPADSVDMVLTSPPFLALRSYLPADHPDKHLEMGSEATPGEFLDGLLDVVEALDRVLAPHGSICIELGDTYSGSGGASGDYIAGGLREGQDRFDGSARRTRRGVPGVASQGGIAHDGNGQERKGSGWPADKSLCLIPQLFAGSLAYGRNLLTGRATPPWRVRNVVRWCRPNPPVGALGDKFRPATSEMVVACHSRTRYFDLDAVRTAAQAGEDGTRNQTKRGDGDYRAESIRFGTRVNSNPAGAPPLDWWNIPTAPYPGSHYATWPPDLCVKPIITMCPLRVCRTCGEPLRRIVDVQGLSGRDFLGQTNDRDIGLQGARPTMPDITRTTVGWTDCDCSDDRNPSMGLHGKWRTGVVLDPFAGSGTTLAVATGHGRDAIGIDLDPRNADLVRERVGMFLDIENDAT